MLSVLLLEAACVLLISYSDLWARAVLQVLRFWLWAACISC